MKRLLTILLSCCWPCLAGWSLVNRAAVASNPPASSLTLNGTTTGHVLTLVVEEDINVPGVIASIANSGGATWTRLRTYTPGANAATIEIWRGDGNTGQAVDVVTPTYASAVTTARLYVQEWSGLGATDNGTGIGENGAGGAVSTNLMAWSPGNLILAGYEFYCDSTSVASGFTLIDEPDTYGAVAYGTAAGSSGVATGTGLAACGNMIVAASFKAAAAAVAATAIPVVM